MIRQVLADPGVHRLADPDGVVRGATTKATHHRVPHPAIPEFQMHVLHEPRGLLCICGRIERVDADDDVAREPSLRGRHRLVSFCPARARARPFLRT
eukprot:4999156-Pleurochrysis_carterae.AAC.1